MHPIIQMILEEFESVGNVIVEDEVLYFGVYTSKNGRESVGFALVSDDDEADTLHFQVFAVARYQNGGARNKKYLECLQKELNHMDLNIKPVGQNQVCISGSLTKETFGCPDWESAYPEIGDLLQCLSHMLISLILIMHINVRMGNQGGSDKYKKLLPSRLAALTMCGHIGVTPVN